MGIQVYYILKQCKDKNPSKIFTWLGISPKLLQKSSPVEPENDVILYIQWGYSRAFDDIDEVCRILPDYPQVKDTSTIYILAMSTYDNANRHSRECVRPNTRTEGNITFFEIHCSYDGKIHTCNGNNETKEILRPKLKLVAQRGHQNEVPTVNSCCVLKCSLLFLVLPILIVIALFVSIALSISNCRECLVSKNCPKWCQCVLLPWALPFLIVVSIGVSIGVSISTCFMCVCCKLPVQIITVKKSFYQLTNSFWKSVFCINSTDTDSLQRILHKTNP